MKELDLVCVTSECKPIPRGWTRFRQTANNHLVNLSLNKAWGQLEMEIKDKLNIVSAFQENYEI